MEPIKLLDQDKAFNRVVTLLIDCRFAEKRTRDKAEEAIALWEKYHFGSIYLAPRGLVCYPDLLGRYLVHLTNSKSGKNMKLYRREAAACSTNSLNSLCYHCDLTAMICRCIENSPEEEWCSSSLDKLLTYHLNIMNQIPLKLYLLPKKYNLDLDLYEKCLQQNIRDKYLDAYLVGEIIPYLESKPQDLNKFINPEKKSQWTDSPAIEYGYRQAYHRLLYSNDLDCLVQYWLHPSSERLGLKGHHPSSNKINKSDKSNKPIHRFDCVADAAYDYFSIPHPEGRLDEKTQGILLEKIRSQLI